MVAVLTLSAAPFSAKNYASGCVRFSLTAGLLTRRTLDERSRFRSARFSSKQPKPKAATASSRTMRNKSPSTGAPHTD